MLESLANRVATCFKNSYDNAMAFFFSPSEVTTTSLMACLKSILASCRSFSRFLKEYRLWEMGCLLESTWLEEMLNFSVLNSLRNLSEYTPTLSSPPSLSYEWSMKGVYVKESTTNPPLEAFWVPLNSLLISSCSGYMMNPSIVPGFEPFEKSNKSLK